MAMMFVFSGLNVWLAYNVVIIYSALNVASLNVNGHNISKRRSISPFEHGEVCVEDPDCNCIITELSPQDNYQSVTDIKTRLSTLQYGSTIQRFESARTRLLNVQERLHILQITYKQHAISITAKEITDIKVELQYLTAEIQNFGGEEIGILRKKISYINQEITSMWNNNPYKLVVDLKDQVSDLKGQLSNCHSSYNGFSGDDIGIEIENQDWCARHNVSGFQAEITHRYVSTARGLWLKDPLPVSNQNKSHVYMRQDSSGAVYFVMYSTNDAFITNKNATNVHWASITGLGAVVYNGSLYYVNNQNLYKYDMSGGELLHAPLKPFLAVNYHASTTATYVDLKVDEIGLWAIYATRDNNGKMEVAQINPQTLQTERTWLTNSHKATVCATFMICGRFYTIDDCTNPTPISSDHKQYVFDTASNQYEYRMYHVPSKFGHIWQLTYNSRERALFGWDNGHLVTYSVKWD